MIYECNRNIFNRNLIMSLFPTQNEVQNIMHKLAVWKLVKDKQRVANTEKYPQMDSNYPYNNTLFKVLCVIDPNSSFEHTKVAEAKEFIEYWKNIGGEKSMYG